MANFQSSPPLSTSSNVWRLLLLSVGALLVVLITIDISIRILLPLDTTNSILSSQKTIPKCYHASTGGGGAHTVGSVFRPIEALENLGPVGDGAWDSILSPAKGGFLYVKSNDSSAGPEPWGVGMFHSLHCLGMLRAVIQKQEGLTTGGMDHEHHLTPHISHDNHAKHCLSYLAQSILCAADSTLEPPHITYDADGHITTYAVDGVGVWHQCKDSSVLWQNVIKSAEVPFDHWDYKRGDTIDGLWGGV